ncbi:glycoside hydrolase family 30 protein [soil metagenome]
MKNTLRYYLTARDTNHRLTEQQPLEIRGGSEDFQVSVLIDREVTFQTHLGFGGAFTEASAVTLGKLGEENRDKVLRAYFDPREGLGYTLCRTHINSCDFSLGNYASVEKVGDVALESFSLVREKQALLPMIHAASALCQEGLLMFASPWSPPAWMKTTGEMNRGGKLRPEYREAWANYYVRYIQEMEKEGVPIWGLTVQNEPAATQTWDSCVYSAEEESDFIRYHLGPALEKAELGRIKVIIWDHNRDYLVHRARVAYHDPEASKYIWGAGFHWYGPDKFDNVRLLHDAWPDKHLIFTEGCQEGGPHTGEWALGERYARSIVNDLNRWTEGWVDWNLLLDETGGPNHVGNLCSAPILADTRTDAVLMQSSYYYIGHFARYIRPGARRVLCATSDDGVEATAYANPDGSLATVTFNPGDEAKDLHLDFCGQGASTKLLGHSIATFVLDEKSAKGAGRL